ncbi:NAD(P)-binding protein [Aureobasidium pullulans]|uniref:NAD(P)-binding protein n=1 Tax=Aureobasidium pullulans TaxID=5580 RepID=A0A4S9EN46_AURPU|nr:NAD(P)-binding protein [Aureobasidium pullulans]THY02402.1 NAD(P)-binding protein [Aureobasidium pullulans]
MPTAVVTGCNSGIGHSFARVLISEGYEVIATDYIEGDQLKALQCRHAQLDVRSPESISAFASSLSGQPIDMLLNVAGTMAKHEDDSLENVSKDTLTRIFETNTFGPLLLTQALLPNLLKASEARIGIVSSRVGSIADNSTGGIYAYRASKAALNSIGKSLAMDLKDKGIIVTLLHPGIVKTGLDPTAANTPEAVLPDEAASKLWKIWQSKGIEDTGKFWHREGQELPW